MNIFIKEKFTMPKKKKICWCKKWREISASTKDSRKIRVTKFAAKQQGNVRQKILISLPKKNFW